MLMINEEIITLKFASVDFKTIIPSTLNCCFLKKIILSYKNMAKCSFNVNTI